MRLLHNGAVALIIAFAPASVALAGHVGISISTDNDRPQVEQLLANLQTVNQTQGSLASGFAVAEVRESPNRAEIDFFVRASGLEPNRPHLMTVQGLFAEDPFPEPNPRTVDLGTFFEGRGGTAIQTSPPQFPQDDLNGDDFITFVEALPAQGPVIQHLTFDRLASPRSGVSPTQALNVRINNELGPDADADVQEVFFRDLFPTADTFGELEFDETFTFDLNNTDERRQFNNLTPMVGNRVIVLHGLTIDENMLNLGAFNRRSITTDGFDLTAPAASGVLLNTVPVNTVAHAPTPTAVGSGLALLAGLLLRRRRAGRA